MFFFRRIKKEYLLVLYISAILTKLAVFIMVFILEPNLFGDGNDADYYHSFAIGESESAANGWALTLRYLNDLSLYNRSVMNCILFALGVLIIPVLTAEVAFFRNKMSKSKEYWALVLVLTLYPTLYYYTFDIYRDVFMIFLFLLSMYIIRVRDVRKFIFYKFFLNSQLVVLIAMLYALRPYLGVSIVLSLLLYKFYSFKNYPLFFSFISFLIFINFLYYAGVIDRIILYRSLFFNGTAGGSNLGIEFSTWINFIPDFILSLLYQLFGVFFVNKASVFVFLLESVPFIIALTYMIKNRVFSNAVVDFLVVFFVIYTTVWVLGNDNLGTSVRLRAFSYISIYLAAWITYVNKNNKHLKKIID